MSEHRVVAHALLAARRAGRGPAQYPASVPSSLSEAYAIQDEMIAAAGEPVIGWKVARLPAPMAALVGHAGIAGPIFHSRGTDEASVSAVGIFAGGYGAGEAEYLLRLGNPPPSLDRSFSVDEAAAAIGSVHVGIEVASSPIAEIVRLGPAAVAADFGINSGIIIGPQVPDWRHANLEAWRVSTAIDGKIVGSGRAEAFADGLPGSVHILFAALASRGHRLLEGQWIASGAVTGAHPLQPGQTMQVDFGGRHEVTFAASTVSANPREAMQERPSHCP